MIHARLGACSWGCRGVTRQGGGRHVLAQLIDAIFLSVLLKLHREFRVDRCRLLPQRALPCCCLVCLLFGAFKNSNAVCNLWARMSVLKRDLQSFLQLLALRSLSLKETAELRALLCVLPLKALEV